MEHYQILKKNEITAFSEKWIDLECVMLSEVTQFLKKITTCSPLHEEPSLFYVCMCIYNKYMLYTIQIIYIKHVHVCGCGTTCRKEKKVK